MRTHRFERARRAHSRDASGGDTKPEKSGRTRREEPEPLTDHGDAVPTVSRRIKETLTSRAMKKSLTWDVIATVQSAGVGFFLMSPAHLAQLLITERGFKVLVEYPAHELSSISSLPFRRIG